MKGSSMVALILHGPFTSDPTTAADIIGRCEA